MTTTWATLNGFRTWIEKVGIVLGGVLVCPLWALLHRTSESRKYVFLAELRFLRYKLCSSILRTPYKWGAHEMGIG